MENTLLNLIPAAYLPEVHISQYDIGRTLTFNLKEGASDYNVPTGATVTVKATKPSGFGFAVPCTFSGGVVTLVVTETMTPEHGRFPAELSIVSGNTTIGTSNFIFNIERSPHPEGTIDGDAETIIPELTLLVERIEAAAEDVDEKAELFLNLSAEAETLPAGSLATANYSDGVLTLGIPRGYDGDDTKADAIVKTASGEVASFTDGGNGLLVKSLNVNIVPKQSGSGDPSPSNVRPISGYEGVNVTRCGKNLFEVADITADNWNGSAYNTITNLQLTKETNGVSIITYGNEATQQWVLRKFNLIPNKTYSFRYVSSVGNERIFIRLFDGGGNNISSASIPISGFAYNQWFSAYWKDGGQATFTIPSNCSYAWVGFGVTGQAKNTKVYFTDIQLELGSTATAYEPYQGTSYPISLGQTVYGGVLDVVSGKLVIDTEASSFNGTENIGLETQGGHNRFYAFNRFTNITSSPYKCSHFIAGTSPIGGNEFNNVMCSYGKAIYWRADDYATVDAMKTYFAQQNTNGTPVTLVSKIATPIEIQLTPTQVTTLLGNNNIWADSGDVEVEYRADTTLAYNELLSLIASLS